MRVGELEAALEKLAPKGLAEPGDNCGLLVGDESAPVRRVLAALELTQPVLKEALAGAYETILTHHPLLFSPVRRLVESQPRERLIRGLVAGHMSLIACHTNLDAAPGGLADIAAAGLGLRDAMPLRRSAAGWYKLVGFVPSEAVEAVAAAVFSAGGGGIGNYKECAYSVEGRGWFTPQARAHPVVGEVAKPERTPETRWETVVQRSRLARAIAAFIGAHPYEEPAFDIYPVEDVWAHAGLGRVGTLIEPATLAELASRIAQTFTAADVRWSGDRAGVCKRVGVVPGAGRSLIDAALDAACDVLVTGDLSYHDAERAGETGLSLIEVPHGDLEWWAFTRWCASLALELAEKEVVVAMSQAWRSPWEGGEKPAETAAGTEKAGRDAGPYAGGRPPGDGPRMRLWIDGGSRGNPGPSAIGVVLEDTDGSIVDTVSRVIGTGTNNAAEYRALLAGLEMAERAGARSVEVLSDSELLVNQMAGKYRVKSESLRPLYEDASCRARAFESFAIRHVSRQENARADGLVNRALDERR